MNAEEFAEFAEDQDWVHQATPLEKVVFVTLTRSSESPYTHVKSLSNGWLMVYENHLDQGDVRCYAPMEWFTDD